MDPQVLRASVRGYANPFSGKQAPDHRPLGFATQEPLEAETKYYPYEKPYPRFKPSNVLPPLPEFPFGVQPTFSRQEDTHGFLRGNAYLPDLRGCGRTISADLVEMYDKIDHSHKSAPAPLSDDYKGSPWMYGALYGLPLSHVTNGNQFISEYGSALSDAEFRRRTDKLVQEGYEPKRIHEAMEHHVSDYLRKRLATR
jgi:hypothetical protein